LHPDIVRAGVPAMAVLALVIGEGTRRGRHLRRVSLFQIESKCDRRVNPAAMPRLHFATTQLGRRHSPDRSGRGVSEFTAYRVLFAKPNYVRTALSRRTTSGRPLPHRANASGFAYAVPPYGYPREAPGAAVCIYVKCILSDSRNMWPVGIVGHIDANARAPLIEPNGQPELARSRFRERDIGECAEIKP
jgi:hypothetical protein